MRAVIAAAGTGGHINPGIAIANKIMEKEPDSKIIFIGTNRGLENDLVPRAGYELKCINSYGISRKINLVNINKLCKTIKSISEAKKILKEFKLQYYWQIVSKSNFFQIIEFGLFFYCLSNINRKTF